MIEGFTNETHELTDYELTLIEPMLKGLRTKIGEENAITNTRMTKGMKAQGYKVNPARMRKLLHHIRVNHLIENLVSSSKGYYIATTRMEVVKYKKSLQQRLNSIKELLDSFDETRPVAPISEQIKAEL